MLYYFLCIHIFIIFFLPLNEHLTLNRWIVKRWTLLFWLGQSHCVVANICILPSKTQHTYIDALVKYQCPDMCIAVFTLYAGLLTRSQYSEGLATGHLDTGFSWFPFVYKQMLRWFPRFQVTTTCFSCIPPDLNLLVTNFIFCMHVK